MHMAAEESLVDVPEGFEGAVAGLSLPDVIQMSALNRFAGCITIQYGQSRGSIYMRDGEIIHAERGDRVGEQAFYEILQWPGGKFHLQPKVTTTSNSIRQSCNFLLMEACRLMDENRDRAVPNEPVRLDDGRSETVKEGIAERVSRMNGVSYATVLGKDGTPVTDRSYQAENLAARTMYLAMMGDSLGNLFGLGEVKAAAVQGTGSHLLLFEAKNHYLGVAVNGDASLGAVETEIRETFVPKK